VDPKLVRKVARQLFVVYSKQTTGAPAKWQEASPDTRKLWIRLARVALKAGTEPKPAAAEG